MSADPLRYFRVEARELSGQLGEGALKLEQAPTPELVAHLLRLAHTLKGAAGVVRQREIAALTHALEDRLTPLKEGALPPGSVDAVLAQVDAITARIAALDAPVDQDKPAPEADGDLDGLLRALGEAGTQLRALRRAPSHKLEHLLDQAEAAMRQAHGAADGLRLVSCRRMFAGLERAARDAARETGKPVVFAGLGADLRLEAQLLAAVQRALVQLVRNAVAHGIERDRGAKPPAGRIAVEAVREGQRVTFRCRDDGRGMDLDAIEKAARARGLAPAQGRDGLLRLVLAGGLTTATGISELSGRGIGMDILRETAQALGGTVSAETKAGQGTCIALTVPASLAALEALLVRAGDTSAAIPLAAVEKVLWLADAGVTHAADGDTLLHDGRALRLAPLARLLGASGAGQSRCALVLRDPDSARKAAISVDALLGAGMIVTRPLPALAFARDVAAAVMLDGDGVPQPVLDPAGLARAAQALAPAPAEAVLARPPVLVIDDSLTTRVLEQSILESAGYEVDLATCAEEGLEKARRRRYGLILVDVEMPGMDGFTFVRTIRADPQLADTPAILVTSRDAPEDRRRGAEAGAHAYIVKSEFEQGKVLEIIRGLLT